MEICGSKGAEVGGLAGKFSGNKKQVNGDYEFVGQDEGLSNVSG